MIKLKTNKHISSNYNTIVQKDLHDRYNIKKIKKLDPAKAAAHVGLQLPNVKAYVPPKE